MGRSPNKRRLFKKYKFRLSKNQSQSMQNYCELYSITPNKLIKNVLKTYTQDFTDDKMGKKYTDKLQLSLFHERDADYEQLNMFDNIT